jgi:hypothetical protein
MAAHLALVPVRQRATASGWQTAVAGRAADLFRVLQRCARHKFAVCLCMAILPVAIRLAALRVIPPAQPMLHDEFSYLLAADTFRSGRLTNPTPPMWQHFETFHELMQPTYQSKYPPAQGMFLALGWKLLGSPWYGVLIGFGLMCGCICWMLQGWLPPVYALLGTLVAMGQLGIFGYWVDSFWGGAVAAAAGTLVLGALPRIARKPSFTAGGAAAVGIVLLANSRPYEGAIMVAGVAAALLWMTRGRWHTLLSWRMLVPLVAIVAAGGAWTAYYNYRVTGHPLKMPYAVYYETYSAVPQWFILPLNPHPPQYRHDDLRRLWDKQEIPEYLALRHNPLRALLKLLGDTLPFYCSTLLFFAIAATLLLTRSRKVWIAAGLVALVCAAVYVELWRMPHYVAGGTGLVYLLAMYGGRLLRVKTGRMGAALVLLFAATPFVNGLAFSLTAYRDYKLSQPRAAIEQRILAHGGRHLVIVHYEPDHDVNIDWVFNAADIDGSPIIWARDMGPARNREILSYYPTRQAWLLHPDTPLTLVPYPR